MPDPQAVKLAVLGALGSLFLCVVCIEASKSSSAKWRALWLMGASLCAFGELVMFGWFYLLVMK